MVDKATLAKARQELEDIYLGIPDDSVDLTLKDLADSQQIDTAAEKKLKKNMSPIHEEGTKGKGLNKVPSIDFARAVQEAKDHHRRIEEKLSRNGGTPRGANKVQKVTTDVYDDASHFREDRSHLDARVARKRPGIPHSNICTLCSDCIYIFRHRCLVCGRVYCRKCVGAGMEEKTEGRKCVECLGRRFSQRYIMRAGQAGCCWRYPSAMRQQELKWAEKGPRKSGERGYGRTGMAPRSPSPVPRTPERSHATDDVASFVASSIYSPTPHGFPI